MLWHYAHGKPKEQLEQRRAGTLARILAGDFGPEDDE
jgi:hypothetical protein